MTPELQSLIQLQELDDRISQLRQEIAALPRHIAEIEKALESHQRKLEADRAALSANQKERKQLESHIQSLEEKASKLRDQMMQARSNEQLWAFQHEVAYCEGEIRKAEDRILDLMAEAEPLERNVIVAEAALAREKAQVAEETARAKQRTAEDRKALETALTARKQITSGLGAGPLNVYERLRKRVSGGRAVAEAVDGRCSLCHLALRPQFFQDLKLGEKLMTCESCGRILYHVPPPESFDDQVAAGNPGAVMQG